VVGNLVSLLTTLKGLPLTYNRDLQEDKEPVFDAAEHLIPALSLAAQVVETTTLEAAAMRQASVDGWLCATDLAEWLASKGVPFHSAHEIAGKLVLESLREGVQPGNASLAHLKRFSPLFDKTALPLLKPEAGVARRTVAGGTAPSSVRDALKEARRWLKSIS
jgi:argininosuccinate lyase